MGSPVSKDWGVATRFLPILFCLAFVIFISIYIFWAEHHGVTCEQGLGRPGSGVLGGRSLVHDDPVRQVSGHDEVVLHHEGRLLHVHDEALDDLPAPDPGQPQALEQACMPWASDWGGLSGCHDELVFHHDAI